MMLPPRYMLNEPNVPHLRPRNAREVQENQEAANNAFGKCNRYHFNNTYPEQSTREKNRRVDKMLAIAAKHKYECKCVNCEFFVRYCEKNLEQDSL